jgi:hypothetical protein
MLIYACVFLLVEEITENLPASWDRTGWGMLSLIVLFFGFIAGSFKIGAAYSDRTFDESPGSLWRVYQRPVRSFKYGIFSLVICFAMVYSIMVVNDFLFH